MVAGRCHRFSLVALKPSNHGPHHYLESGATPFGDLGNGVCSPTCVRPGRGGGEVMAISY